MAAQPIRVKIAELKPGMGVLAVTALSAEYTYLDSRRVAMLKSRMKGAKVAVVRNGAKAVVAIDAIFAGDHIAEIGELPAELGYATLDAAKAQFLKELGFQEFLVTPAPAAPQPEPAAPSAAAGPSGPEAPARSRPVTNRGPSFASAKSLKHKKSVAEGRYMLERVQEADAVRLQSSEMVKELFQQSRTGRFSIKPAVEAVEHVLRADVGEAMAVMAGLKSSDQTYSHCIDMAVLFNDVAVHLIKASGRTADERTTRSTLAAGFMHDIGKSKVPREVLECTERLAPDSQEMQLMRSHVTHSAKILSDTGADKAMINVAHYHHVKKDAALPSSYPAVDYAEVLPFTRLAAIVDAYQALIGKRSYRKNLVPGKAVALLRSAADSEFDPPMLASFINVIGKYPVGSLVKLSTGDLAFVVKVESHEAERPIVALVENAKGELLSVNPMADLMEERALSIVELVDHYEHYDASDSEPFEIFKSLKLI